MTIARKNTFRKKILSKASAIELLAADVKYKVYLAIPSLTKEKELRLSNIFRDMM